MVQQGIQQTQLLANSVRGLILPALGVGGVLSALSGDITNIAKSSGTASNALGVLGGKFGEVTRPLSNLTHDIGDFIDGLPGWASALTAFGLKWGALGASIAFVASKLGLLGGARAAASGAAAGAASGAAGGVGARAALAGAGATAAAGAGLAFGALRTGFINDALSEVQGALAGFQAGAQSVLSGSGYLTAYRRGRASVDDPANPTFLRQLRADNGFFSTSEFERGLFGASPPATAGPQGNIPAAPYQVNNTYYMTGATPPESPTQARADNGGQPVVTLP